MLRKFHLLAVLMLIFSMLLGACGAPAPVAPAQAEQPTPVPATEVPPTAVPTLDVPALLEAFWATVPADKGYGTIAATKLSEELADKAPFLLDVREAAELEKDGYIEGAVNLPVRTVLQNLDKLPGVDEPIVIYCASGHRGALTMMALKMMGYTNVRNLGGGIGSWKKANLPLATSKPAEATAISTPIIADQLLYTTLNDFLTNLPEGYLTVKADALNTMLTEKAPALIDVRSEAEVTKDGYIEGSVNVPFADFLTNLDKLPADKAAPVVIYCASGHRGAMAMMALRLLGYTEVSNLAGGLGSWKAAKMPVAGWVDWPTVYAEFLTSLPADQGFYSTSSAKLNETLASEPPFILDVREASEVEATGYIIGSVNIPVRDVLKNLDKLPTPDKKIVVTCASGHRGSITMMALRMLGYENVVNLGGGINGWKKAELPLEAGVPAVATVINASPSVDATRLAGLDAYLSALPEGFFTVKPVDLNTELGTEPKPVILDVRTSEETTTDGYIEGSLLVPVTELPTRLAELPTDKTAPIVVTCKSGHRGAMAMVYLQSLGYSNVRNLGGGISGWIAAELPVAK